MLLKCSMQKIINSVRYEKLVVQLKKARLEQGLTLRDLGKRLGIVHTAIDKIERGERRLDVLEYVDYCRELNFDPTEGLKILEGK